MYSLSEYFLIRLTSSLKSLSATMVALAVYLRDAGQVPLSMWRFSAWIAFSVFLILSSGCKVSLYRRFRSEWTFPCRLLVCTFSWLVAELAAPYMRHQETPCKEPKKVFHLQILLTA